MTETLGPEARAAVVRAWCNQTGLVGAFDPGSAGGSGHGVGGGTVHASPPSVAVSGVSMLPTFREGERVVIDTQASPKVGDVIVFADCYGNLVVHRLVWKRPGSIRCIGDNRVTFDDPVRPTAVVGVVRSVVGLDGSERPVARLRGLGWARLTFQCLGASARAVGSRAAGLGRKAVGRQSVFRSNEGDAAVEVSP